MELKGGAIQPFLAFGVDVSYGAIMASVVGSCRIISTLKLSIKTETFREED